MRRPALLIAAAHSGAGKTTVALALALALRERGRSVQAFKTGPDYLDPAHLAAATGRPVYNLDGYFLDEAGLGWLYRSRSAGASFALVEGAMGLFDGKDPRGREGSSAQVARLLGLPVVLVVDAGAMAGSIAALARGFRDHDPGLDLAGVVANRVAGPGHAAILREALAAVGIPLLGTLPQDPALALPERHLGLVPPEEADLPREALRRAARGLDLAALLAAAARARGPRRAAPPYDPDRRYPGARIAYARDRAFFFYYPEVLEALAELGAELVPFSPLADPAPPEAGLVWLGGGYPELFAPELARNRTMQRAVRRHPGAIYAECGGYLYLARGLVYEGLCHPMVGLVPGVAEVADRPVLGYREVEALRPTRIFAPGERVRGHEFHHARLPPSRTPLWRLSGGGLEGHTDGRVHASFVHLYPLSNPRVLYAMLEASGGSLAGGRA